MNIKILSDSTCDLSPEQLKEHDITLARLTVVKDGEAFVDGLTITPADIFAHVAAGGDLCSTTANNIGDYQKLFDEFCPKYDGVILITIGSAFSSCYQNACLAAEDYPNVRVIDSMNLSTGQGHVVLEACRLAKTCESLDEIAEKLNALVPRVEASFLLDQLKYMVKGGRCSSAAALGANLLNLKPCIEVRNGKMSVVKKYRGNYAKCLAAYVQDRLADRDDIIRNELFLTYTPVTDECLAAVKEAIDEYGHFETVYETTAGCTVSCHCGPATLGVLFVRK
ncbi:MAG: DegV family protein [Oscillospiraceae bacterium]|nr:DegV family protein [Oscillospiraceae bacterium]MBQ9930695.1 DegV family protein [Oscillospiraceae bacterium]